MPKDVPINTQQYCADDRFW